MVQYFGYRAEKARMDISSDDLGILLKGERILGKLDIENGYVILAFESIILGLGLLIDGWVISQIPKKDTRRLKYQGMPHNP